MLIGWMCELSEEVTDVSAAAAAVSVSAVNYCWISCWSLSQRDDTSVLKITFPMNHILQFNDLILILQSWDWSLYVCRVLTRLFVINGPVTSCHRSESADRRPDLKTFGQLCFCKITLQQISSSTVCVYRAFLLNVHIGQYQHLNPLMTDGESFRELRLDQLQRFPLVWFLLTFCLYSSSTHSHSHSHIIELQMFSDWFRATLRQLVLVNTVIPSMTPCTFSAAVQLPARLLIRWQQGHTDLTQPLTCDTTHTSDIQLCVCSPPRAAEAQAEYLNFV